MSDSQESAVVREEMMNETIAYKECFSEKELIPEVPVSQGYAVGEVPQLYISDPHAFLPLNSDLLVGSSNMIRGIVGELDILIDEELKEASKLQRQISLWEEKIRRNNAVIGKNLDQIKQNTVDMSYDKKNREYWWGRGEIVIADFARAAESGKSQDWAWLIKKYGLKNPDGTPIDHRSHCVEELCNGATNNLAMEYREAGIRYDQTHKNKEAENALLMSDNSKLSGTNDQLQKYIENMYASEIEPLQDGALLLKEFVVKLKSLERQETQATYGDLREWAESYLDAFLRKNSAIPHRVVNAFRRLSSIPLPAQNS